MYENHHETYSELSRMFDHALLTPTLTSFELVQGIELAKRFEVASVCVLPFFMKTCCSLLRGTEVMASTVIGFPHGTVSSSTKRHEAEEAIEFGCQELDMVINQSDVQSGNWDAVRDDILAVLQPAHAKNRKVKVIFETCNLNQQQKLHLCEICTELNVDWVKTSTGFSHGGATLEDVQLMIEHTGDHVQVKASGGIRSLAEVLQFRAAGVTRIGTSKTADLLNEWRRRLHLPVLDLTGVCQPAGY